MPTSLECGRFTDFTHATLTEGHMDFQEKNYFRCLPCGLFELNEDEAIRRAIFVEQMLLDDGVPADRMKRWIYSFPAKSQDIVNSVDHPSIAETKELSRGVWIFRSDC